jgi:integrase
MSANNHAFNTSRVERGLHYFKVWQTVTKGGKSEVIPVLYIIEHDVAEPKITRLNALVDYFMNNCARSATWMLDLATTVGSLIDYTAAWLPFLRAARNRSSPEASFAMILRRFVKAHLEGTKDVSNGNTADNLGLYWQPKSPEAVKKSLSRLTDFLQSSEVGDAAWSAAVSNRSHDSFYALRIAFSHVVAKRKSLLAHVKFQVPDQGKRLHLGGHVTPRSIEPRTFRFPIKYVWKFLFEGFIAKRSAQADETAQLIAFLLFASGVRYSELFHAWVQDVQFVDSMPVFIVHHPSYGTVVDHFGNRMSRAEYLMKQARPRRPRNQLRKRGHAGFKGIAEEANGTQLIWLPIDGLLQEIGVRLQRYMSVTRPRIMRLRKAQGLPDHNYLFVGSGHTFARNTNETGAPYTMEAFRSAWARAIRRTSSICDDPEFILSKSNGTTIHAARHFYGSFLKSIGVSAEDITKCMHHRSPFSSLRYVSLNSGEMDAILRRQGGVKSGVNFGQMAQSVAEALKRQQTSIWKR